MKSLRKGEVRRVVVCSLLYCVLVLLCESDYATQFVHLNVQIGYKLIVAYYDATQINTIHPTVLA